MKPGVYKLGLHDYAICCDGIACEAESYPTRAAALAAWHEAQQPREPDFDELAAVERRYDGI